jgi:hypothetical protein
VDGHDPHTSIGGSLYALVLDETDEIPWPKCRTFIPPEAQFHQLEEPSQLAAIKCVIHPQSVGPAVNDGAIPVSEKVTPEAKANSPCLRRAVVGTKANHHAQRRPGDLIPGDLVPRMVGEAEEGETCGDGWRVRESRGSFLRRFDSQAAEAGHEV